MELVRQDAQRLSRQLARHDTLYRQILNLRRELLPAVESLANRRRREEAALASVEIEVAELKREGFFVKIVRSGRELLGREVSREELLRRRRLEIVERLNGLAGEQRLLDSRYRDLVEREEVLLREIYGEPAVAAQAAPWLFGVGCALATLSYAMGAMQPFWASMAIAGAGAVTFWLHATRQEPNRIASVEEDVWRRIRAHHDRHREGLVGELENVGVLLKEFREPAADGLAKLSGDDTGYYRSITAILVELARRDGAIGGDEQAAVFDLLETELGLSGELLERMKKQVLADAENKAPIDLPALVSKFRDAEATRLLLRLLYRVAFADGKFFGREQTLIDQVARMLDASPDQKAEIRLEEATLARTRGITLPDAVVQTPEPLEASEPIVIIDPVPADIAFVDGEPEPDGRRSRRRQRE